MPKQYIILSASMGIINCDVCVVCMYGVCVCVFSSYQDMSILLTCLSFDKHQRGCKKLV